MLSAVEERFDLSFRQKMIPGGAHHYKETGAILPKGRLERPGKDVQKLGCSAQGRA